jgi:8-oxo-dGTP pyrophosphatase MutT (NUDIX family)
MGVDGERDIVREACAVAYRLVQGRVQFCLLLIPGDSRWEFPHGPIVDDEPPADTALRLSHELTGLECEFCGGEPIGSFEFVSGGLRRIVTAFLLKCVTDPPVSTADDARRRQWFLPEEARARLRRKPMRLIATVAQRRLSRPSL